MNLALPREALAGAISGIADAKNVEHQQKHRQDGGGEQQSTDYESRTLPQGPLIHRLGF